jgi:hypothetical protein
VQASKVGAEVTLRVDLLLLKCAMFWRRIIDGLRVILYWWMFEELIEDGAESGRYSTESSSFL